MAYEGFPSGVKATPVPSPLLGPLLMEMDDLAELRLVLRVIWLLQQKRGPHRSVTMAELHADPVLARAVDGESSPVAAALERGVRRGVLLRLDLAGEDPACVHVTLNDEPGRRTMQRLRASGADERTTPFAGPPPPTERRNIYRLYEENIGVITPMIAEELRAAEETYLSDWIAAAFREAVVRNRRHWRYVARILERWATEGRGSDGEPGRHPQAVDPEEFLRQYGRH